MLFYAENKKIRMNFYFYFENEKKRRKTYFFGGFLSIFRYNVFDQKSQQLFLSTFFFSKIFSPNLSKSQKL